MLDKIIKAYDIRGLVKDEITPDFSFSVGVAFAKFLEIEREPGTIVVGEDMRPSSAPLAKAFCDGANSQGMDVIRIGLSSTDMLYFASGKLNLPGIMFTASHNPAKYNGMKLCKSGARPVGKESGLQVIKDIIEKGAPISNRPIGQVREQDLLKEYVDFLIKQFPKKTFSNRKIKVVIDAGNGMAGFTAPAVMEKLNVELIPMYFELDGNFPNHEANPIEPENLKDLQKMVKKHKADIGLAFDGDADRCFLINEKAELVNPSALTALIAVRELKKNPKSAIIYNLISSKAVPEVIAEHKGRAIRSRVGHSYIKNLMAETGAVFAGEHSGHFYFKNFWKADSGMLAALYALAELMQSDGTLSELLEPYNRYFSSGEINSKVKDAQKSIKVIKEKYQSKFEVDELDGLTVTAKEWWFNLRASNTEPLLRLNVEAQTQKQMAKIRDSVLSQIKR
ncbi:MAG: phosphomannomutase/phosphoglucomutase [Actinobacteria bacterium]|nr:phosphomannomutase/phosphoglucomutase [Actinomycetota bacterium]NCA25275.1 phosphomannomutase/phosphoglucomutase [Actinomycetota bacterium]NCU96426.1 phosphomannomutase/phosphoglucomutase [Actinomycetota bacterium]NDD78702.1 phosphomannomutase/phosphoglucomutase [Actinomycetota bacterium]